MSARSVFVALAAAVLGCGIFLHARQSQAPPPQKPPAQQQIPTFKAEARLVRVDAYVTAGGKAVEDLEANDFDVLEDNVRQKVETFEYIRKGRVQAGKPSPGEPEVRGRLFVLLVDTYHLPWVDRDRIEHRERTVPNWQMEPMKIPALPAPLPDEGMFRDALKEIVNRVVGDDDRVAVLTPDMWAGSLTFMERQAAIDELATRSLKAYVTGQRPPELNRFEACFPQGPNVEDEMRVRYRLYRTFTALDELIANLELVRDDRKALLLVTRGWDPPPRHSGYRDPRVGMINEDPTVCHAERMALADRDFEYWFRSIIDAAKRSNVAFYSIYAHPLVTYGRDGGDIDEATRQYQRQWGDTPLGEMSGERMLYEGFPAILRDRRLWHDALTHMSKDTNGRAILGADDFEPGLKDIADALSSYYLLGYYSTNTKRDSVFRKITVSVKRKGVDVRARPGYRAVIPEEAVAAELAARPDAVPAPVIAALAPLARLRNDVPFHLAVSPEWDPAASGWRLRVVGEIDSVRARAPEWRAGWRAELTITAAEGLVAGTAPVTVKSGQTAFSMFWPATGVARAGDYEVRAKAYAGDDTVFDQRMTVNVPARAGAVEAVLGQPLLSRRPNVPRAEFQPTADQRFNRREILLIEVPVSGALETPTLRLLDRRGRALGNAIPSTVADRKGSRVITATIVLSNVAPGDYILEIAASDKAEAKMYLAFRVVP